MALHILKLCVGVEGVDDLKAWQDGRIRELKVAGRPPYPYHDTRMTPKRSDEILAGGSIYWVIKHRIMVRQRIVGLEAVTDGSGKAMCRMVLDPALVRTQARRKRPFQGWRYLEPKDAPADLDGGGPALSADLESALKEALAW